MKTYRVWNKKFKCWWTSNNGKSHFSNLGHIKTSGIKYFPEHYEIHCWYTETEPDEIIDATELFT